MTEEELAKMRVRRLIGDLIFVTLERIEAIFVSSSHQVCLLLSLLLIQDIFVVKMTHHKEYALDYLRIGATSDNAAKKVIHH